MDIWSERVLQNQLRTLKHSTDCLPRALISESLQHNQFATKTNIKTEGGRAGAARRVRFSSILISSALFLFARCEQEEQAEKPN